SSAPPRRRGVAVEQEPLPADRADRLTTEEGTSDAAAERSSRTADGRLAVAGDATRGAGDLADHESADNRFAAMVASESLPLFRVSPLPTLPHFGACGGAEEEALSPSLLSSPAQTRGRGRRIARERAEDW